jgi:hypothetical protein
MSCSTACLFCRQFLRRGDQKFGRRRSVDLVVVVVVGVNITVTVSSRGRP